MLTSKFNLYNDEWLDVVFANRNKEYGAYELRKHHGRDTMRALFIALVSITVAATAYGMAIRVEPAEVFKKVDVINDKIIIPPPPKKEEVKPPKPEKAQAAAPAEPQKTEIFTEMRPTDEPVVDEPPTIKQLENAVVSSVKSDGVEGGVNADPGAGTGTGGTGTGTVDNTVYGIDRIEKMPEPVGGNGAWAKFLQKNIRYPQMAMDQNVSGKVFVSFIIEKDGQISNVTLLRGPGYGLDEEAIRVLKKAPAWKPGIQNGQPVRVKFTIPINFSLGEE